MKGILSVKEYRYMWHITIILLEILPPPPTCLSVQNRINSIIYVFITIFMQISAKLVKNIIQQNKYK